MVTDSEHLAAVTELFDQFAKSANLEVIARAVDKHGASEWAAMRTNEISRFATLDLIYEPTIEGASLYSGEVWFGAESGRWFVRRLSSAFRINLRSLEPRISELVRTQNELIARLRDAWAAASTLSADDLVKARPG